MCETPLGLRIEITLSKGLFLIWYILFCFTNLFFVESRAVNTTRRTECSGHSGNNRTANICNSKFNVIASPCSLSIARPIAHVNVCRNTICIYILHIKNVFIFNKQFPRPIRLRINKFPTTIHPLILRSLTSIHKLSKTYQTKTNETPHLTYIKSSLRMFFNNSDTHSHFLMICWILNDMFINWHDSNLRTHSKCTFIHTHTLTPHNIKWKMHFTTRLLTVFVLSRPPLDFLSLCPFPLLHTYTYTHTHTHAYCSDMRTGTDRQG